MAKAAVAVESMNSTYSLGWWSGGALAVSDISSVSKQMRQYLKMSRPKGLQSEKVGAFALKALSDNLRTLNINSGNVAMQLCELRR
ncbi:hypothetical protein BDV59DRAFT_198061 [Aspergillus ambiguus]|uniref:uncharacterized protein n=1 Tax=Aspergillus ambiguus TaxID=176160 RepID=UPI003CCCE4B3